MNFALCQGVSDFLKRKNEREQACQSPEFSREEMARILETFRKENGQDIKLAFQDPYSRDRYKRYYGADGYQSYGEAGDYMGEGIRDYRRGLSVIVCDFEDKGDWVARSPYIGLRMIDMDF